MERRQSIPFKEISKAVLRTGAASGLAAFGVTSLDIFSKPQIAEATNCRSVDARTVREFVDVGGVKDQFDPAIDILRDPISKARVKYILNGKVIAQSQETNTAGVVETEINTECNDPSGRQVIILSAEVTTADGRHVTDQVVLQNNKKEKFTTYVVDRKSPLGSITAPGGERGHQNPYESPVTGGSGGGRVDGKDLPAGGILAALAAGIVGLAVNEFFRRGRYKTTAARSASTTGTGTSSVVGVSSLPSGISGVLGGPSNPNITPNFGPTQQKNPEWVTGQQEFEKRWQDAKSKLSPVRPGDTGNEPEYILDRFKAGMSIVHEVSLNNMISVPLMAIRIRAGIEYLIPQIWPENRILKRFFDPNFNVGYLGTKDLAKIVYLPEKYRNLSSFTNEQRIEIRRIHRILLHALHSDTSKGDSDKNLQESVDDLLKRFNPAWSYIENLIK